MFRKKIGIHFIISVTRTCASSTSYNNTVFTNEEYPANVLSVGNCDIEIHPTNDNICQIRLDFDDFEIPQPNNGGECDTSLMIATGGATYPPIICGYNTGQHSG